MDRFLLRFREKVLVISLGFLSLIDIGWPESNEAIETIKEIYTLSLEQGKTGILVLSIAIILLARNIPILVRALKKMFRD